MPLFNEQLLKAQLENSASDLTPTSTGLIYFNTSTALIKYYNASAWKTVVDTSTAQALTNKDLTSATNVLTGATAGSFTNTGTVTLFTATDTIAGKATTDEFTNKYYHGGTASTTNRIKLPNDSAANLATLAASLSEGDLVFDTTNHQINYKTNSTLVAVASSSVATPTASGTVTSFVSVIASSTKVVSSANYTILDTDGFDVISISTAGSDRTITLPASATNIGRKIRIKKTDSGAGAVIIARAGSDTIDGAISQKIYTQYGECSIYCEASGVFYIGNNILEHGRFTQSFVKGANISVDPTATSGIFSRVGRIVTVSGNFTASPGTGTFTATQVRLTLPIPSTLAAVADVNGTGVAFGNGTNYQTGTITGNVANAQAILDWNATDTGGRTWNFVFTYEIK